VRGRGAGVEAGTRFWCSGLVFFTPTPDDRVSHCVRSWNSGGFSAAPRKRYAIPLAREGDRTDLWQQVAPRGARGAIAKPGATRPQKRDHAPLSSRNPLPFPPPPQSAGTDVKAVRRGSGTKRGGPPQKTGHAAQVEKCAADFAPARVVLSAGALATVPHRATRRRLLRWGKLASSGPGDLPTVKRWAAVGAQSRWALVKGTLKLMLGATQGRPPPWLLALTVALDNPAVIPPSLDFTTPRK